MFRRSCYTERMLCSFAIANWIFIHCSVGYRVLTDSLNSFTFHFLVRKTFVVNVSPFASITAKNFNYLTLNKNFFVFFKMKSTVTITKLLPWYPPPYPWPVTVLNSYFSDRILRQWMNTCKFGGLNLSIQKKLKFVCCTYHYHRHHSLRERPEQTWP